MSLFIDCYEIYYNEVKVKSLFFVVLNGCVMTKKCTNNDIICQ